MTDDNRQLVSYITKTKYAIINETVKSIFPDDKEKHESFMTKFREIFNFDPNKKTSSPSKNKKTQLKRDKLKEEGISTYISAGVKKSHEKKKAAAAAAASNSSANESHNIPTT